jgi:hypothetical protein
VSPMPRSRGSDTADRPPAHPAAELGSSQVLAETATRTSRPGRAGRLQDAEGSRR